MKVWVVLDYKQHYTSGTTDSAWSTKELAESRKRDLLGRYANITAGYWCDRRRCQGPNPPEDAWSRWCIDEHEVDAPS